MSHISQILAILLLALICGCSSRTTAIPSFPSPDGSLEIVPGVKNGIVGMKIVDASGAVLYETSTEASNRMRWDFHWEDNDTIVFESSDLGDSRWVRLQNGSWSKQ